jgi:gliding motility-associated-like protein
VTTKVLGGDGPYKYELLADGVKIKEGTSATKEISFSAETASSNLGLKITDNGCAKNASVTETMLKTSDFSLITSVIEGEKTVCKGTTLKLSVKNIYSGHSFEWKKGNNVVSTSKTLEINNFSDADTGEYSFSMIFDGCDVTFLENFNLVIDNIDMPNVTPAFPCLNSTTVSLNKYVSKTDVAYTLIWYKSDNSLIGETAPEFNPNNIGTFKYFIAQKRTGGCEGKKAELTIVVEELPAEIGANNVIFCNDPSDPKPKMIVINAGNNTYNLYDAFSGGNKIGSGTASNDTANIVTSQNLVINKIYYLQTENTHGCVSQGRTTIPVTVKESLILGNNKICFGDNLSLSADYPGGKITWTKPDNSVYTGKTLSVADIKFTDAGIYSLLIEESGLGCTMRDKIQIKVTQPVPPTVSKDSYRYYENETASSMTATPKAGLTLKWYNPDGNLISGNAPVPATNQTGVFVYHVSQDSVGCESPKVPVTVVVGNIPDAVPASDITVCIADKPSIQIHNTIQDFTYTVYYQANVIATGKGNGNTLSLTSAVSISENAIIEITVADTYDVSSAATQKNVIAPKNLIAQSPSALCYGASGQLDALNIASASYKWTTPKGAVFDTLSISISNAGSEDAGNYILAVTTPGCPVAEVKTSVKVTQPAPPTVDKTSYVFYENETATGLVATPKNGLTLKWYNPDGALISGQSPIPATNQTGSFIYHVSQDSLGCESPKVAITVIVGNIPESVPASDINICIADKPVITIQNTIQDYTYSVRYKNNEIATGAGNGNTITLTSNVSIVENAEIEVTVIDDLTISSIGTKKTLISLNNIIDNQLSNLSLCEGSSGNLIAVDITGASYVWTTPTGTFNEQSVSVSDASSSDAGQYTLSLTTPGCPVAEQSVTVTVAKPANPVTTKEIYYCIGDNATALTATALSGYKLVWFNELFEQLPNAPVPNTFAKATIVYYVSQVSLSDANCESDKEEITVYIEEKPEAVLLSTINVCAKPVLDNENHEDVSVVIPGSLEGYTYGLYTQDEGGSLIGQAISDGSYAKIMIAGGILSSTTYYLQVTNKAGCVSERTPVEIVLIEITLSPNELPSYQIDELYSERLETNASNPTFSIVAGFLPPEFSLSSMGDISGLATSFSEPLTFTVEVANDLGCAIQKEYTLKSELIVSKMFSPNGDGVNDVFMKGYKVIIFDRLGRKLFSGENGWDGTFNGKSMPEDVYYYLLYYNDKDGKTKHITGYVTSIKTF